MNRLHIIGRKNHGKTTLVVDLVTEFINRQIRVGTIKHTHHRHELDTPGKDSHRHREAGAAVVGIMSPAINAVFLPSEYQPPETDRYAVMSPLFANCELVLVEGDSQTTAPKIEVWRAVQNTTPIALEDRSVVAVVTDDPLNISVTTLSRKDITGLADWISNHCSIK